MNEGDIILNFKFSQEDFSEQIFLNCFNKVVPLNINAKCITECFFAFINFDDVKKCN